MIISHILGGLGNQMFQYAAARALALSRQQAFRLDLSGFNGYRLHHGYELERVFGCPVEKATATDVRNILGWQSAPLACRVLARPQLSILRRKGFVVEPHFSYWPGITLVPPDCYLVGYWQSERYFKDAADTIRKDFTFRQAMTADNAEVADQISRNNAVSLHVRRGDYVSNPRTYATHGVCSTDYYLAAIRYVSERIEQPRFFVFSDDISWVKSHLAIGFPCRFIAHNQGMDSHNDMRLMSLCRHHIIANSSFSWWGAWLNPSPGKLVVAPKLWFAEGGDVGDLFPSGWVAL